VRLKDALVVAAAWVSMGGSCGKTCPPEMLPQPMTEARAHAIDPSVVTGVAFSTTHVFGDCRKASAVTAPNTCGVISNPVCAKERAPLEVLMVPVNTSIEMSGPCSSGFAVSDLRKLAVLNATASASGELVRAIAPGRYVLDVALDDSCAACGLADAGEGCLIDVVPNQLTVRDLLLDQSAH
jgi:hypothetical protein